MGKARTRKLGTLVFAGGRWRDARTGAFASAARVERAKAYAKKKRAAAKEEPPPSKRSKRLAKEIRALKAQARELALVELMRATEEFSRFAPRRRKKSVARLAREAYLKGELDSGPRLKQLADEFGMTTGEVYTLGISPKDEVY